MPAGSEYACLIPAHDRELRLFLPERDIENPEVSIVIPACNEELTIGDFVCWAKQGLEEAGVSGEILIINSSRDETGTIALGLGARVLEAPRRGLGRAYLDAIPLIRGRFVLMGDADCTYDFRVLAPFIRKFEDGNEFVMGSRFRGYIEPGSMPPLHRYLGTPVTTWILNVLYGTRFSDIHCGMRGVTLDGLRRMNLQSQSWEYASEMVLKSVRLKLPTAEVPVRFYKDRDGRTSHHKRAGWFSPWHAAWINLRAMFLYGADYLVFRPGVFLLATGCGISLPVTFGPVRVGPVTLSLYWMLLGMALAVSGLQSIYVGCIARVLYDRTGDAGKRFTRIFSYDRSAVTSALLLLAGIGFSAPLVKDYVAHGLSLPGELTTANYCAVTGLLLILVAFINFVFTLVLHAAATRDADAANRATDGAGTLDLVNLATGLRQSTSELTVSQQR